MATQNARYLQQELIKELKERVSSVESSLNHYARAYTECPSEETKLAYEKYKSLQMGIEEGIKVIGKNMDFGTYTRQVEG